MYEKETHFGEHFVKCTINGHKTTLITTVSDKIASTAKREAARKMLAILKNENYEAPEIDEVPSLEHEIAYFYERLRDKKGKKIDGFNAVQKDDGRSGLLILYFKKNWQLINGRIV